jgi:diguanylate cyclase (GGDEF)-like protein
MKTRSPLPYLAGLLALVVLGLLVLQAREAERSSDKRIGFYPAAGAAGVLVGAVTPGLPAAKAGMAKGDEIVAIAGSPVRDRADYDQASSSFERGHAVDVDVLRQGRRVRLALVPGVPTRWFYVALNALAALAYLAVALLALSQWRKDPRIRLLVAFTAALAIEIATPPLILGRPTLNPILGSLLYLLNGIELATHFHLVLLLPEAHPLVRRKRWVVPLCYGVGLTFGALFCLLHFAAILPPPLRSPWGQDVLQHATSTFVLPLWSLGVTAILASQARAHSGAKGGNQAGLVLAGTLPWAVFLFASALWEWRVGPLPGWAPSLETGVLLLPSLAFLIAIARYRLFNLEILARRSLVYAVLTGSLLLVFYAALGTASALFSQLLGRRESIWAVSIATLALGLAFSPLRQRLQGAIERRFFPERAELRQRLIHLASELSMHGNLPKMGRHLVVELTSIFTSPAVSLLISSSETGHLSVLAATSHEPDAGLLIQQSDPAIERLRRARRPLAAGPLLGYSPSFARALPGIDARGVLVPLHNQERLVGVLGMGAKVGRERLNGEEIDLLSLLAHHLAVVLENARLTESATYDGLTGLLRREAAFDQLERELDRARRYRRPLAVAMADLDHFKSINDRYGHLAGDIILKRVARILAGALRGTDYIGRYGGEEFLLIWPETDLAGAAAAAEKIRLLVHEADLRIDGGPPIPVTLSIGIATLDEVARNDPGRVGLEDLLAAADRSLYTAKHGGRNRIHPLLRWPEGVASIASERKREPA